MPAKTKEKLIVGCKLLRADGSSLNDQYGRITYQRNGWQKIPGNGAYLAATGGVSAGGGGPLLAWFDGRQPTGASAPAGVVCCGEVRWRTKPPKTYGGDLYLSSLTKLSAGCLPQSVGGGLSLDSLTKLSAGCLPQSVGGGLYLSSLTKENREQIRHERPDLRVY